MSGVFFGISALSFMILAGSSEATLNKYEDATMAILLGGSISLAFGINIALGQITKAIRHDR